MILTEKAEKAKRLMSRKSKDGSDNCGYRSNLDPALIDKLDEVYIHIYG